MSQPLISIVLPVTGHDHEWEGCVEDLLGECRDGLAELILVDDAHEPALSTYEIDRSVTLVSHPERAGAAASRNAGASQARGELLFFFSSFFRFKPGLLEQIQREYSKDPFDYLKLAFAGDPHVPFTCISRFLVSLGGCRGMGQKRIRYQQMSFAAAVMPRAVFEDLGGFDGGMSYYGGHEQDLALQMLKQGRKKVRCIRPGVWRIRGSNPRTLRLRMREYGSKGLPAFLRKHPEEQPALLPATVPWNLLRYSGLSLIMEWGLRFWVWLDLPLPSLAYRGYLHLLMRNAWHGR